MFKIIIEEIKKEPEIYVLALVMFLLGSAFGVSI